ncbi:nuclear protein MDM1 isoform X4 [Pogoniulus pusillus]|uniref:nuclear protein MDM1 isoform X4 n=1 Tax=Pogoniulus pusillus TaxID=488313 RepID=UPI0030B98EF7
MQTERAGKDISNGETVKEASPEGVPEQEGGLESPGGALRSGEAARNGRRLPWHRTGCGKGLSEYKRNFRWKTPELCSSSQQQRSLWAGLRSDQFGITREPNFISKRRVPYHNPQISKSFEWTEDGDLNDPLETDAARSAELHTDHNNNDVNQETTELLEGPRLPKKVWSHSVDSTGQTALAPAESDMKRSPPAASPNQNEAFSSPEKELGKMSNGLHRVLQRKADMNIPHLSAFPRNSEYQSQFVWRSPHEKSPILAAEQAISNRSKSIPPLKSPAITSETGCERNGKGSPPVKDPEVGAGLEGKEFLVKELRERAKAYRQRVEGTHFSRYHLNQILSDNNSLWDVSSNSSSEEGISSNIRALDLAGVSEKETAPSPRVLQHPDPREQPQQDSSDRKELPDALSAPVKRRLAWGEQEGTEERENPKSTEEEEHQDEQAVVLAQQLEENNEDANEDQKVEGENALGLNSSAAVSDSSSVSSRAGGRLPTPQLRARGGAQRTHHDLTTPAVGGAVLVSPPKLKSSQRRAQALATHPSPAKKGAREASKRKSFQKDTKVEAVSLLTSPPAGLRTLDPLPLRQDRWPATSVSKEQVASAHREHSAVPPMLKSAKNFSMPFWSPSPRIQGTLKDPEFQHNGNLGNPKPRPFQLPLQERNYSDEDERLSQLSARSAASSSLASQILERAQKRKDFWGKT